MPEDARIDLAHLTFSVKAAVLDYPADRSLMATPKQVAREILDSLPEDCSLEDIAFHLYVRAQVEEGVRDLDEGRAVPHEQVMREAAEWLRKRT